MNKVEKRLQNTVARLAELGDSGSIEMANQVLLFQKRLKKRLQRVAFFRWILRVSLIVVIGFVTYYLWSYGNIDSKLELNLSSWNELISVASNGVELCVFLVPVFFGIFFIERLFERGALLSQLSQLESLNDSIYDEQFDDNPYNVKEQKTASRDGWLLEYLDCCTALLLTVRMLAHTITQQTTDRVVLDRCGIVRRGAGDNHTRILLKIGILKTAVNDLVVTPINEVKVAAATEDATLN
jgi:hypothetical protein